MNKSLPAILTTGEVAIVLGYTIQHTRLLIRNGELRAKKLGRDWIIEAEDVRDFMERRAMSGRK